MLNTDKLCLLFSGLHSNGSFRKSSSEHNLDPETISTKVTMIIHARSSLKIVYFETSRHAVLLLLFLFPLYSYF
jgi:hypothetical protein